VLKRKSQKKGFWSLIFEKSGWRRIEIILEIILEDGKRIVYFFDNRSEMIKRKRKDK
jgi:hypothetical protein